LKQKKLANFAKQKREIDAAINALRKPNRSSAAKEIVDEIERRKVEGTSSTRRPGLAVQVTATPKKPKQNTAAQRGELLSAMNSTSEVSATETFISSSTIRPSIADGDLASSRLSTKRQAILSTVDVTPSRESSKRSNPLGLLTSSQEFISRAGIDALNYADKPQFNAASLVQATPSTNRLHPDMLTSIQNTPLRTKQSQRPVLFTPLKKTEVSIDDMFKDAPEIPEKAGKAMDRVMGGGKELSIYDSLGWNDDFDDVA